MGGPAPGIEVFRLEPAEAAAYAAPMQSFLADTLRDYYVGELGRQMVIHADPTDTGPEGKVDSQRERIAHSTDLSIADTSAYMVARDERYPQHNGLVGLLKLTRHDERLVEIEELDIALDRRGQGIGTALLRRAVATLAVNTLDVLTLDVLVHNVRGRAFWQRVGFQFTGEHHHHEYAFPNADDYHLQMTAPVRRVHSVLNRLADR